LLIGAGGRKVTPATPIRGEPPGRSNDVMPTIKAVARVPSGKGSTGRIEYRGLLLKAA
jgi:hypothetical protein